MQQMLELSDYCTLLLDLIIGISLILWVCAVKLFVTYLFQKPLHNSGCLLMTIHKPFSYIVIMGTT